MSCGVGMWCGGWVGWGRNSPLTHTNPLFYFTLHYPIRPITPVPSTTPQSNTPTPLYSSTPRCISSSNFNTALPHHPTPTSLNPNWNQKELQFHTKRLLYFYHTLPIHISPSHSNTPTIHFPYYLTLAYPYHRDTTYPNHTLPIPQVAIPYLIYTRLYPSIPHRTLYTQPLAYPNIIYYPYYLANHYRNLSSLKKTFPILILRPTYSTTHPNVFLPTPPPHPTTLYLYPYTAAPSFIVLSRILTYINLPIPPHRSPPHSTLPALPYPTLPNPALPYPTPPQTQLLLQPIFPPDPITPASLLYLHSSNHYSTNFRQFYLRYILPYSSLIYSTHPNPPPYVYQSLSMLTLPYYTFLILPLLSPPYMYTSHYALLYLPNCYVVKSQSHIK